jgi:subtilisin family serine protease
MLCPVDYEGNNADCSKAPHVVSNSWGMEFGSTLFNPVLQAWDSAGILSSFSAGNQYSCSSMYTPADQPGALGVGATDEEDDLATFSSKGPSLTGLMKPEISAPGTNIYSASAVSDTAYMSASGTSMSCPLTTGVLALLKTFNLNLSQSEAFEALTQTAVRNIPTGESCGGVSDEVFPNNHIGYGRIDAYEAITHLARKSP